MTESSEEIMQLLNEKIKYGQDLIQNIQSLNHVDGAMKLQRKVRQEIEFLKKLLKSKKVKIEQLSCSNLRHLGALVECALRPGVTAVCKIFHISNENKLVIDIVSDDGKVWIKVIARNPRSLSALSAGNASYGARSILDQAEDYITCATLYPCMYKPPQVLSSVQFLANGGYQRQIGQDHSLCAAQTTTGKFIDQFVNSLNQRLLSQWIQFPGSEATRRVVSRGFQDKFGVPNVLGAIDCTHVKIFPPSGPQGAQYKNLRKGDHTINVQLVIFEFVSGIEETLANKLKAAGVIVKGEVLPDSKFLNNGDDAWSSESGSEDSYDNILHSPSPSPHSTLQEITQCITEHAEISTLNLDVTAMMAYISNMTNGHCNYVFKQEVLTQQAAWEAERPVKPILQNLFEGKTLVCCRTAWDDFEKIVQILGGTLEKQRMAELKKVLTIYPDDYAGQDDYPRKNLKVRGHVRIRSKIVFNFGHRIKALTVSANEGFIRAAKQQGVTYAAFIHESRALTEGKEASAHKKET